MNISIAVQTHPLRLDLAQSLAEKVGGAEVVSDPDPDHVLRSPWRTYRHALERTPEGADWRVVLQDDVLPCRWFRDVLPSSLASRPGRVLTYYVGGSPAPCARQVREACARGNSWVELRDIRWCPALALAWPVELIAPFLAWVDEHRWRPEFRADDEIIGRWMRDAGLRPLASVPSLIDHPDEHPSLIGRRAMGGVDLARVAACFIDPACDARTIDWTLGD